jgi:predicted metalloprotease with PDZ domain
MSPDASAPARIIFAVPAFEPMTHRVHFALEVRGVDRPTIDLVLPVWAPGAYELRESAREVRDFRALRPGTGDPLRVERVEKNRWRVHAGGAEAVEVRYTVYGHDLADDGLDVSEEHLYLTATRCFPYVEGREREPIDVVLPLPPGWKAYAELARISENPVRFRARDFEQLVDSPIDAGTPVHTTVRPGGIPHHIVLCGRGNYELHRVEQDVQKVVEAHLRYFGDSPLDSYTFLFHLTEKRDGGLEHQASTSIVIERGSFAPDEVYEKSFLGVVSHEYFHLWNVKRIRPTVLGPFDFTRENYTHLLWWMEGTTDYVSTLLLRHAGLLPPAKYLAQVAELARRFLQTPGRHLKSLEEASFTAWIDLYRPYEESRNTSVSYYVKGHLVSLALDLELRARTDNVQSLQPVFRHLWTEYGRKNRGIGEDELQGILESVTGVSLGEFFDRYVRGTAELPIDQFARHAGLAFGPAPKPKEAEGSEPGYLGIETANDGGRLRIREVLDGGPARRAGLSPGDELVALDGAKVLYDGFAETMKKYPAGKEVEVTVFRRGLLRTVPVTPIAQPPAKYVVTPVDSPSELARKIYQSWLEAPWEPAKPAADR